jgi:hypothetical protein
VSTNITSYTVNQWWTMDIYAGKYIPLKKTKKNITRCYLEEKYKINEKRKGEYERKKKKEERKNENLREMG